MLKLCQLEATIEYEKHFLMLFDSLFPVLFTKITHWCVEDEKKTYSFWTKSKKYSACRNDAAAVFPFKLKLWFAHGIFVAEFACVSVCAWKPLYLPDILAALSCA